MEKNDAKYPQADVRVLTLKRWNFPQTSRLFPLDGDGPTADGDYISYNSHHFIHIEECVDVGKQPIRRVHQSLEHQRNQQHNTKTASIHTVQSLTLLGEKGIFWDTPGDILYISFLQLTNAAVITAEEIQKNIDAIIKHRAPDASWALYHSLDFCDFVLFTKNLTYATCNSIMWDLAIVRGEEFSILRDTFTIYGFHHEFLKDSFQKLEQGKYPQWNDQASLSIQLSIQSYDVWKKFEESLKKEDISYRPFRTFGRYDVRLITNDLSGKQILQLLYILDNMAAESKDKAFGGYEISMETPLDTTTLRTPTDAIQDRELEKAAGDTMDLLCRLCAKAGSYSTDYVDETRLSLKALLKNGFSEEFVLSVLSTFLSFLQITIDVQKYRDRIVLEKDEECYLNESQEKMTRHYFNALNILALCTMHSERQFVQAPAFNATYFDVPPKLLAFYSAVARKILDTLRCEGDADYHFLFVPNYQKDINVRPLELEMQENISQHLAVAHLHESYFYDPVLTIKLFCHEAAHYLSDRHREDRAKYIFRVISFILLTNTPLHFVMEEKQDDSILAVMADSLADFLLDKFVEQTPHFTRNIPYHLEDVSSFLANNGYGIDFFIDPFDVDRICARWQNVLYTKTIQEPDTFGDFFAFGLKCIQKTLESNYLLDLFQQDPTGMYVYEVFSRFIAHYASFPNATYPDEEFYNLCENIIQAFSEAYADLRMIELIGEEFSCKDYTDMFLQVDVDNHYQTLLRHDAVLTLVAPNGDWEAMIPKENNPLIFAYVAEQIRQYLDLCHMQPTCSNQVVHILQDLKDGNIAKQCGRIRETIQEYRIYLNQYCQKIISDYSSPAC